MSPIFPSRIPPPSPLQVATCHCTSTSRRKPRRGTESEPQTEPWSTSRPTAALTWLLRCWHPTRSAFRRRFPAPAIKVRIQKVIHGPGDPHEFTYELGNGYMPLQAADGSIWAYRFDQNGAIDIYGVGEAWARDADGAVVNTHYEIRGNSLVQVVTPTGETVYPVVADPTWEWYNAAYGAGFSKRETRDLANLGGIAGLCSSLWRWPALGAACGIAGFQWWTQAGLAVNADGCVFIAAVPAPLAVRWLSSACR